MRSDLVTFACVLYQGEDVPQHSKGVFNEEWVDRLYRGIKRNCTVPFRLVCFVDRDDYRFNEPVETKKLEMPYRNMFCLLEPFREDMGRVVFMGLDTIITGNIDHIACYRGPFMMIEDPYMAGVACSGVMMFPYTPKVWEAFKRAHEAGEVDFRLGGYLSDMLFLNSVPHETIDGRRLGIYSYKAHIKPRPESMNLARIVYFHGREKPNELQDEAWVAEHWGPPVALPEWLHTLNNERRVMLEQFRKNLSRPLRWFDEAPAHDRTMILVGGGPSLADSMLHLRMADGDVFALNGTHDYLIARGIVPDYHVLLDSRQDNVRFVQRPHKDVKYLISACCHPSVFDALSEHDVTLWMADLTGAADLVRGVKDKPVVLVGGGPTVGLKSLYLGYLWGYRRFVLYGFDSCYRDGENHAYRQDMNDGEQKMEVFAAGRRFVCAPWMAYQAQHFQAQARKLTQLGCVLTVCGDGLIPWVVQQMEAAA